MRTLRPTATLGVLSLLVLASACSPSSYDEPSDTPGADGGAEAPGDGGSVDDGMGRAPRPPKADAGSRVDSGEIDDASGAGASRGNPSPDAAADASTGAGDTGVGPSCPYASDHALGPNDVSILTPVPSSATPLLTNLAGPPGGAPMVPESLFNELVVAPGDAYDSTFTNFQLEAIRFDLCDRVNPGVCAVGQDGRLRLGFQAFDGATVEDISVHAFYTIPAADLPCVVAGLRELAALANDATTPLGVAPGFSGPNGAAYVALLKSLVFRYGTADNLQRLTELSQLSAVNQGTSWIFRGYALSNGSFTPISIPTIDATSQTVAEVSFSTYYELTPFADVPSGFGDALSVSPDAGSPSVQAGLTAGAQVLNPLTTGINSVQCAGCHTIDYVEATNAQNEGITETAIAGWYTSSYPLGLDFTDDSRFQGNLRMFGYQALFLDPVVSQRVVNETAQVLTEIEQRYP
jgi:hypothetical protein